MGPLGWDEAGGGPLRGMGLGALTAAFDLEARAPAHVRRLRREPCERRRHPVARGADDGADVGQAERPRVVVGAVPAEDDEPV